ncbi:MAG TPA: ParA family protein [Candidatus Dormibacteraeota bacterium]
MAPVEAPSHAVIVLVEDQRDAQTLAGVIEDVVRPGSTVALIPPFGGAAFFADGNAANAVDHWWAQVVPPAAAPIYVMDFNPAAVAWLPGLDGRFIIRGCPVGLAREMDAAVEPANGASALELAARVLRHLAADGLCDGDEADGLLAFAQATTPIAPRVPPPPPPLPPPNPFDLLAAMPPDAPAPPQVAAPAERHRSALFAPAPEAGTESAGGNGTRRTLGGLLRRGLRHGRADPGVDDLQLANELAHRRSTIVAIGSRKGGVGKTSHAAGMAIVAGSLLDTIGHRAVIVDANVANPDAWGVLNLPPGAATVRDTVAALDARLDPPRPVYATTPSLACYPEARETSDYSRRDIHVLADYLRHGFTLAVIDLSNRLPDPTGGPEAAAAAYWLEVADAVVLPTAWSKQDFNGVLDYLELDGLPPAVVAYITPRTRRHREHPLTQRYLDSIAQRAHSVVKLPDEADAVRYAGMAGVPIDSVSRRLRGGYRSLVEAVLRAARSAES